MIVLLICDFSITSTGKCYLGITNMNGSRATSLGPVNVAGRPAIRGSRSHGMPTRVSPDHVDPQRLSSHWLTS